MINPSMMIVRLVNLEVKKLDKKEKGMIIREGDVKMSLIIVGFASGKAFAISTRAGEIAAQAITVAIEIDIIVGLSILFNIISPIHIKFISINEFHNTGLVQHLYNI